MLTKRYGNLTAVDAVTFSIGERALRPAGPNGSGKTTTTKMLTGQLQPTSGSASAAGIDPARHPLRVKRAVGIIPEKEAPPSFLTAEEYLQFVTAIRGIDDAAGCVDA